MGKMASKKSHKGKEVVWKEGNELALFVVDQIKKSGLAKKIEICGSLRRKKERVGDIDILVIPVNKEKLREYLCSNLGFEGGNIKLFSLIKGIQFDIFIMEEESWGAALLYLTGSKITNIRQRIKARKAGYFLNEKGLFRKDKRLSCSCDERLIYKKMGWNWLEPEER